MGRLDWSFWPRPDRRLRDAVSGGRRGSRKGRPAQRLEMSQTRLLAEALEERTLLATLTASGPVSGGLIATYYDNMDFTNRVLTRVETQVNFSNSAASPAPGIVDPDTYSV